MERVEPPQAAPELAAGQIWRRSEHRRDRFVHVEAVFDSAFIRTVVRRADGRWQYAENSQTRTATKSRFNNQRRGYTFVERAYPETITAP